MRQRLTVEVLPLLTTICPLIGAVSVLVVARWQINIIRPVVLSNCCLTLLLAMASVWCLPRTADEKSTAKLSSGRGYYWLAETVPDVKTNASTIQGMSVRLSFSLDGWSAWSALALCLTAWAALICMDRPDGEFAEYSRGFLISQSLLLAALFSADAIFGIILLEIALIPICSLIARFGKENRRQVASSTWIWQMIGCSCSLVGVTLLAVSRHWMQIDLVTTRGPILFDTEALAVSVQQLLGRSETAVQVWNEVAPWAALLLLAGFLLRLPVFPFQGWYASTLWAAPAGLSAMLAVALPAAAMGLWLRLGAPLFGLSGLVPAILGSASLVGALSTSFGIRAQHDLKLRFILTSCAVLGLAGVGLSLESRDGLRGACLLTLCHGMIVAAGLLLTGLLEDRCRACDLRTVSAAARTYPRLRAALSVCLLGTAGIPAVFGFAGLSLQSWGAGRVGLLLAQSLVMVMIAAAGADGFALFVTSTTDAPSAGQAQGRKSAIPDLTMIQLLATSLIFAALLLVNSMSNLVAGDIEGSERGQHRSAARP